MILCWWCWWCCWWCCFWWCVDGEMMLCWWCCWWCCCWWCVDGEAAEAEAEWSKKNHIFRWWNGGFLKLGHPQTIHFGVPSFFRNPPNPYVSWIPLREVAEVGGRHAKAAIFLRFCGEMPCSKNIWGVPKLGCTPIAGWLVYSGKSHYNLGFIMDLNVQKWWYYGWYYSDMIYMI